MKVFHVLCVILVSSVALGQQQQKNDKETKKETKPVGIVKQINKINDDGSYTVGYEAEDGTFRLETRDPKGNVNGVYGYLDDKGDLKTVKYGAGNGTGFTAESDLIPKAPQPVAPSAPAQQQDNGRGHQQRQHGGFPQQQHGGFPQQQHGGFPQQQHGGFPQQQQGGILQQQHGGFPQQQHGGFPQQQQQGGFPQQQHGGFPQQQQGGFPQQEHGGFPQQQHGGFDQGADHQRFQQSSPRPNDQFQGFGQNFGNSFGGPSSSQQSPQHHGTGGVSSSNKPQSDPIQDFSLTGFSEDKDEDGFVDPLPTAGAQASAPKGQPQPVFHGQNSPFSQAQKLVSEGKPFFGHHFNAPIPQNNVPFSEFGGQQGGNKPTQQFQGNHFPSVGSFPFAPPKTPPSGFPGGFNNIDDSPSDKFDDSDFRLPFKPSFTGGSSGPGGSFNGPAGTFGGFGGPRPHSPQQSSQPALDNNDFGGQFRPNSPPSGFGPAFGGPRDSRPPFGSFGFPFGGPSSFESQGQPVKTDRPGHSQPQGFGNQGNDFGKSFGESPFDFNGGSFNGFGGGVPSVTEARVVGGSSRFRP